MKRTSWPLFILTVVLLVVNVVLAFQGHVLNGFTAGFVVSSLIDRAFDGRLPFQRAT